MTLAVTRVLSTRSLVVGGALFDRWSDGPSLFFSLSMVRSLCLFSVVIGRFEAVAQNGPYLRRRCVAGLQIYKGRRRILGGPSSP